MNARTITAWISGVVLATWPMAAGDIRTDGRFVSTTPTGTAPLEVASSTVVANLNADKLDGLDASDLAAATGGGVTIDQAKAIAGGVTPSDAPGFPVTLDASGSYRLTSNLDVTVQATPERVTAIEVAADNVTIDLAGFAILGSNECTGSPPGADLVCTYTVVTQPFGIGVMGSGFELTTIRNGVVRGMGTSGVFCGRGCVIEGVRASENGLQGLSNGTEGIIRESVGFRNGGEGIFARGIVLDSVAQWNGGNGMQVGVGGLARGNVVNGNRGVGIRAFDALLLDNMIYDNHTYGIEFATNDKAAWGRNNLAFNGSGPTTGTPGVQVDVNTCDRAICP